MLHDDTHSLQLFENNNLAALYFKDDIKNVQDETVRFFQIQYYLRLTVSGIAR